MVQKGLPTPKRRHFSSSLYRLQPPPLSQIKLCVPTCLMFLSGTCKLKFRLMKVESIMPLQFCSMQLQLRCGTNPLISLFLLGAAKCQLFTLLQCFITGGRFRIHLRRLDFSSSTGAWCCWPMISFVQETWF